MRVVEQKHTVRYWELVPKLSAQKIVKIAKYDLFNLFCRATRAPFVFVNDILRYHKRVHEKISKAGLDKFWNWFRKFLRRIFMTLQKIMFMCFAVSFHKFFSGIGICVYSRVANRRGGFIKRGGRFTIFVKIQGTGGS